MTRLLLLAILGCAAATNMEPEVCEECEFISGVGFLPFPGNCYKYIQCQEVSPGEYRAWEMPCPGRLYWSQRLLTCAREHDGNEECPVINCNNTIETNEDCCTPRPDDPQTSSTPYIELVMTVDNQFTLYVDGSFVVFDDDWFSQRTLQLSSQAQVVAIHAHDRGIAEGIIASFDTGVLSDDSWRCIPVSTDPDSDVPGWYNVSFDDSAWPAAVVTDANGDYPWFRKGSADVADAAKWIWTAGAEVDIICRVSPSRCLIANLPCNEWKSQSVPATLANGDTYLRYGNTVVSECSGGTETLGTCQFDGSWSLVDRPCPDIVECRLREVPRYPSKYYDEEGNLMPCAPGTVFSLEHCTCVIGGTVPTCDDDPWLKFPFDEDYDSTQCDGGTGTPRGNANINEKLCFDGKSSVEIGYLKNWFTDNPLNAITISIWFWHDSSITRIQGLFGNGDCNSNATMLIYVEDNIAKGWLQTSNGIQVFTSSSGARAYVQDGWNQVALVYTGWSLEFWINGEKCDQRNPLNGDVLGTQLPSTIGLAYIDCDPNFFNGCICDFRVYKRVVYEWEMRDKVYGEGGCRQNSPSG